MTSRPPLGLRPSTGRGALSRLALAIADDGESPAKGRDSDLPSIQASSNGKIELETVEEGKEGEIVEEIIKKAVQKVFNRYVKADDFADFLDNFTEGRSVEVSDTMPTALYVQHARDIKDLAPALGQLASDGGPGLTASAVEFILEGLHLNKKLNKKVLAGEISYWG